MYVIDFNDIPQEPRYYTDASLDFQALREYNDPNACLEVFFGDFVDSKLVKIFEGRMIYPDKTAAVDVLSGYSKNFVHVKSFEDAVKRHKRYSTKAKYLLKVRHLEDDIRSLVDYEQTVAEDRAEREEELAELKANPPKGVKVPK